MARVLGCVPGSGLCLLHPCHPPVPTLAWMSAFPPLHPANSWSSLTLCPDVFFRKTCLPELTSSYPLALLKLSFLTTIFFVFLAMPFSLQHLHSPIRERTCVPCIGVLTPGPPGKFPHHSFFTVISLSPWILKIPWRKDGCPLQDSCLENPIDRGAWQRSSWGHKESDMTEQLALFTFFNSSYIKY